MSEQFLSAENVNGKGGAGELGDLLVRYLERLEVDYVFGVPGGAIEPLLNALARSEQRGGPRCVISRHETGAAFMADGYHSATGKLGVCFATTGPGVTNLITGVASAYANHVPLLAITAQTALTTFGRGALQESSCTGINALSFFESITLYNSLVSHPDQLEHKLAAAIITAHRYPQGPVHLSIPIDILKTAANRQPQFANLPRLVASGQIYDPLAFEEFFRLLTTSRKTVFVLGDEAAEAVEAMLEVASWLDIPLIVTPHGKGLVDPCHPLFRGVVGFAGHGTAIETLCDPDVDLVVAFGSRLGEWASNAWDRVALLNSRLVHVATSADFFIGSPMARLHLQGSTGLILQKVLGRLDAEARPRRWLPERVAELTARREYGFKLDDPLACSDDRSPILPQRLMTELPRLFPPSTRYVADSGNSFAWAVHYLHPHDYQSQARSGRNNRVFKATFDFASMGWAIGSAVGIALGVQGTPVVCITGDGSYLMASQEITVAIQEKLPVIYLILNDAAYGMVKHGQRLTEAERTGFDLPRIDFAAMARSMGVDGYVIESVDDLLALDMHHICHRAGPSLLDVRIDGEAKPPIDLRTRVLSKGR
ncbi:MAG: thiamine pyrophosphate-binding protein [Porticoccaceae bacterium]